MACAKSKRCKDEIEATKKCNLDVLSPIAFPFTCEPQRVVDTLKDKYPCSIVEWVACDKTIVIGLLAMTQRLSLDEFDAFPPFLISYDLETNKIKEYRNFTFPHEAMIVTHGFKFKLHSLMLLCHTNDGRLFIIDLNEGWLKYEHASHYFTLEKNEDLYRLQLRSETARDVIGAHILEFISPNIIIFGFPSTNVEGIPNGLLIFNYETASILYYNTKIVPECMTLVGTLLYVVHSNKASGTELMYYSSIDTTALDSVKLKSYRIMPSKGDTKIATPSAKAIECEIDILTKKIDELDTKEDEDFLSTVYEPYIPDSAYASPMDKMRLTPTYTCTHIFKVRGTRKWVAFAGIDVIILNRISDNYQKVIKRLTRINDMYIDDYHLVIILSDLKMIEYILPEDLSSTRFKVNKAYTPILKAIPSDQDESSWHPNLFGYGFCTCTSKFIITGLYNGMLLVK